MITGNPRIFADLNWTFTDGPYFFQRPATTGAGQWTAKLSLPNGSICSVSFYIT